MFPTVELRWFCEGAAPPAGIQAWFQALGKAEIQQPRLDHYLRLAGEPALGIKVREGRLEIKKRVNQYGETQISQGVEGVVEAWRKWSFALAGADAIPAADAANDRSPWLPVLKKRNLLRFAFVGDLHILRQVQFRPERGCEVELTSVIAGAGQWWTLGLESYGPGPSLRREFQAAARRFFESEPSPPLEAANSFGYPEWLARLP